MQSLIDYLSESDPPFPLIFKQHPADARRKNAHLKLQTRRPQDVIRPHRQGNIHQILKCGRCRGVIALNSNVVPDALLWDIPAIALGRSIWPREGVSPFLNELPVDWEELWIRSHREDVRQCTEAYIYHITRNQWSLADARSPERVAELLQAHSRVQEVPEHRPRKVFQQPSRHLPRINIVARNKGWLFEDLRQRYRRLTDLPARLTISEHPECQADAWVFIRAHEAATTPDPDRTVIQLHDLFDGGLYQVGDKREIVHRCGGLALTHPEQEQILRRHNVPLDDKHFSVAPLGAAKEFKPRQRLSPD